MQFTTSIKRLVYPLYIYPKITSKVKARLHERFQLIQRELENGTIPEIDDLRLFSNMEEDGIILRLLASINVFKGNFIDIGSNDCINSNCANLAFNFDWSGLFIDGNAKLIKIGKRNYRFFNYAERLRFDTCFLSPENINEVIERNLITKEIDFMSIDIDGNDFAIWKAIEIVNPKIVVIENKIEYGKFDIVAPAIKKIPQDRWGASLVSITKLAIKKGYTLVATNKEGFNSFYMRNDCFKQSKLQVLSVDTVLNSPHISASFYDETEVKSLIEFIDLVWSGA